jgi:hypothetical protein
VHGDCLTVVCGFTGLSASARAHGTSVVGAGKRTTVVMPEFYDDDVVWFDGFYDLVEAAFDGERARAAAADGFVENGKGK